VMSWSLRHFVSFRSRATLSRSALFAPVRGQTKLVVWPISSSCQRAFGGVGLRKLTSGGCLWLLPARVESIFCDGVEAAWGNNVPSGGSRFALEGDLFADGRLFFRGHVSLERLIEEGFGKEEI